MLVTAINLGDIVTIESHPYNKQQTEIIISGEHQLTPPLMVIAEISKDTKTQFNEKSGEEESFLGLAQCKCIWFSNKSNQFEEAWISSKILKLIKSAVKFEGTKEDEAKSFYDYVEVENKKTDESEIIETFKLSKSKTKKYKQVTFKTVDLELAKKKSSISRDENSLNENQDEKLNINHYLGFVSPVMQIIQSVDPHDSELKEAKFNSKNGERKRFTSNWLLKVKWFNPASDKFSEKILPACVFDIIEPFKTEALKQVNDLIESSKFIRHFIKDDESTISSPVFVSYRSGKYYLQVFDYLQNKKREIPLLDELFIEEDSLVLDTLPTFSFIHDEDKHYETITEELRKGIEDCITSRNYIRIQYKNSADKVKWRTIRPLKISSILCKKDSKTYYYFDGHCMSKKGVRTFKTSNIIKLQILNLNYD